jgi:hypothetical protein
VTAENDDDLTDSELLSLPGESIKPGQLSSYFARRSALISQRNLDQVWLELSGASIRHVMLFGEQDPRVKQQREDEERRRAWFAYEMEMEAVRAREDRLLAYIDEQQALNRERLEDIERRTIRLRDGRRVYVNGNGYVDEFGDEMRGADLDEARAEHAKHPDAATIAEKTEAERRREELEKLRRQIEERRAQREAGNDATLTDSERAAKLKTEQEALTADELKVQQIADQRHTEIVKNPDNIADAYSTDYTSAYGNTRTTSFAKQQDGAGTVLATNFTPAAEGQAGPDKDKAPAPAVTLTPGTPS